MENDLELKKRYMKRFKKTQLQIDRLTERLAELEERIQTIKSPAITGMPRGGEPVTVADLIAEKQELEERISRMKGKAREARRQIADRIDELDDVRYASVLEAFFLDGMELREIAEAEGYTERHTIRLYTEGLAAITLPPCQ